MAKRKKAQPWDAVFANVYTGRSPDRICYPPVTDAQLDEAEARLGSRFPASYRAFMARFGPGVVAYNWTLRPVTTPVGANQPAQTLVERTIQLREQHRDHERLARCVYYTFNRNCDERAWEFAWDPAEVTRPSPHECRVYELNPFGDGNPDDAFGSFDEFLAWAAEESWLRGAGEYDPAVRAHVVHEPLTIRLKATPPDHEVQLWLASNSHTARDLALSIREEGRTDAFPILADALQEAGCTHADLLVSCRAGDPDIDGVWVLQVLLGKG